MLSKIFEGYHVSNLTGIVMYRCTNSSVVYVQQLGRALSTDMNDSCIVFDVVDNLHRKSLFNLSVSSYDKDNESQDKGDNKNKTNWYKKCNDIKSEDLISRGNIAKYRELIDKVVCEPIQHDCREAFGLFFKRWLRVQGKKFPFTEKEFMNTYNKSNEEFCKYIKQKCREISVDYIFDDKDKILSVGKKGDGLPLSVFADFRGDDEDDFYCTYVEWVSCRGDYFSMNDISCSFKLEKGLDITLFSMRYKDFLQRALRGYNCTEKYKGRGLKGYSFNKYKCPKTGKFMSDEDCIGCKNCIAVECQRQSNWVVVHCNGDMGCAKERKGDMPELFFTSNIRSKK